MTTKREEVVLPETIIFNGKWQSQRRRVSTLTENQLWALQSHLSHLMDGVTVLEEFGFLRAFETQFVRGQPETVYEGSGRNANIAVHLVGLGHWQVFVGGRQSKGTRYTDNLRATIMKVAEF